MYAKMEGNTDGGIEEMVGETQERITIVCTGFGNIIWNECCMCGQV